MSTDQPQFQLPSALELENLTEEAFSEHVISQELGPPIKDPGSYGSPKPDVGVPVIVPTGAPKPGDGVEHAGFLGHLLEAYSSPLHLSTHDRLTARLRASAAAMTAVAIAHTNYTEGGLRWDGIDNHRNPWSHPPDVPHDADCSAFTTWALYIATRAWHLGDFVNGYGWRAGYTGTQTQHGMQIGLDHLIHADLVFYGGSYSIPQHVAIYVGNGRVVSHGQQGDPRVYPTDLYGALRIVQARRFIR